MASTYEAGYLYCIGSSECPCSRVKIGISADPESRLKTFQTGCPCALEIKWAIEVNDMNNVEQQVHGALSLWRLHGEWFSLPEMELWALYRACRDGARSGNMDKAVQTALHLDPATRWSGGGPFAIQLSMEVQEAPNAESGGN